MVGLGEERRVLFRSVDGPQQIRSGVKVKDGRDTEAKVAGSEAIGSNQGSGRSDPKQRRLGHGAPRAP